MRVNNQCSAERKGSGAQGSGFRVLNLSKPLHDAENWDVLVSGLDYDLEGPEQALSSAVCKSNHPIHVAPSGMWRQSTVSGILHFVSLTTKGRTGEGRMRKESEEREGFSKNL